MRNKTGAIHFFICVMIGGMITITHSKASLRYDYSSLYPRDTIKVKKYIDPAELVNGIDTLQRGDTLHTSVQLYFRWDKDVIDSSYMSNRASLLKLEELLSHKRLRSIDSIKIKAYASPEGPPLYNQRLSERRGKAVKKVLQWKFPHLEEERIVYQGMGENWEGLEKVVIADMNVPSREKVLDLLRLPLSLYERDKRLQAMDKGIPYRYIFNTYYKRLRNASSIYLSIIPKPEVELPLLPALPTFVPKGGLTAISPIEITQESYRYVRPFAIKTNLAFDVLLMPNIEVEIPMGKRFSLMGEWTFPWWGGLGNSGGVSPVPVYSEKFTMQMLSGGIEARYWFPRSRSLDKKARRWNDYNPLNGWFVGIYGGAGKYDFQFGGDGMQGEFYIASGISGGYAHPIGKYFHMEYSLGIGYLATEYYRYTPMDSHKVVIIRPNGQFDYRKQTWIGPTKAKISLVWIPRFKVKDRK